MNHVNSAVQHISTAAHSAHQKMKSLGTAAYHALPEKGRHTVDKIHGKYLKMTKFDIIFTIIMVIIIVLIIILLVFTFNSSITKKNITVTDNLTVNGTLTAKSTSTETTFNNITCDSITASGGIVGASLTVSGDIAGDNIILGSGTIDCGTISCESWIAIGASSANDVQLSCSSDGNLFIDGTIEAYSVYYYSQSTSTAGVITKYTSEIAQSGMNLDITTPSGGYVYFQNGLILTGTDTGSGTISCVSVTANGVVLTSDYRLKEEVEPISDEYSIDKLKPCSYLLKDDESKKLQTGFIAHELQEIFPHLVNGEKDGEEMQSVNYIGLIAILTKELQILKSVVEELKADNIMLKAKLC